MTEKDPSGRPLTDRELLALPDRGPVREAFGDRYFWPLIVLIGVGFWIVPELLEIRLPVRRLAVVVIIIGVWGWIRERGKRRPNPGGP